MTPSVLGSEDPHKWKLLVAQQDKSIDKELFGHSIMTQISLSQLKKELKSSNNENPETICDEQTLNLLSKHKVETKVAFSKCKQIAPFHAILLSSDSFF